MVCARGRLRCCNSGTRHATPCLRHFFIFRRAPFWHSFEYTLSTWPRKCRDIRTSSSAVTSCPRNEKCAKKLASLRPATMLDPTGIANVVKAEIERQQAILDYDSLGTEELERVVEALQSRLALCKATVAARAEAGAAPADVTDAEAPPKKEAPKMVATKAEGTWPELPWGGACCATPYPVVVARVLTLCSLGGVVCAQWRDSRTARRLPTTSRRTCRSAS